jgi:2'-5' RNA ligase
VQIHLPESADRDLQRKTDKTPGASWPAWVGHVTLLPMFTTLSDEDTLQKALAGVAAEFAPVEILLSNFAVEQDLTRPDYHAVFLTLDDEQEPTLQRLRTLRERLNDATRADRKDLWPVLESSEYVPHVTLAMGLSESEANSVVRTLRAQGLSVCFRLKEIVLLGFDGAGGVEPTRAFSFNLSAPAEEKAGEVAHAEAETDKVSQEQEATA